MGSLALAGAFWGTGFLFGKIALREMDVSMNVAMRFLFGSLFLGPVLLRRSPKFTRKDFWIMLLASLVGIPLQFLVQFEGLELTTVSHASLMVGTLPILLALGSFVFLGERLGLFDWCALVLSGIGVVLITLSKSSTDSPRSSVKGDLLIVVSLLAAVVLALVTKHLMDTYDPLKVTASMIYSGTAFLLLWLFIVDAPRFSFSSTAWFAVAAQGLLATALAYLFWNWGMAHVPAARAGVFFNMEPLAGAVLGVLILHESLGKSALLGGAMILGSALYISTRMQPAETNRRQ
jgi:drug/metabolite transporter (DMT)-like permease